MIGGLFCLLMKALKIFISKQTTKRSLSRVETVVLLIINLMNAILWNFWTINVRRVYEESHTAFRSVKNNNRDIFLSFVILTF